MREVPKYHGCFVCGDKNACGLQARFFFDGEKVLTEAVADERFEGYCGIGHGGITAALLDEVMVKAVLAADVCAVTAEMTVRYHRPVYTGDKLFCTGRVVKQRGRAWFAEGEIVDADGRPFATATGKYIEAEEDFRRLLLRSLE